MKMATLWRAGSVSDPGLERSINEDRVLVDDTRGLFLVVDGLGGHAAGETAAETAVDVIGKELRAARTVDEASIRKAITAANNEIFRLSDANASWRGMACVLTLAVSTGDHFLIGHVGDSRLYLFWNGKLQKVTLDHSPVGELEDAGELTEEQAMRHPRRNEVFRDVGSFPHNPDDPRFIEVKRIAFPPDAALLLCSDGLSDLVKAADMTRIIERYDGDAQKIAQMLVEAANGAGGRDNISVIFVPGPEFVGAESPASAEGRNRHATTRMRTGKTGAGGFFRNFLLVAMGAALALVGWIFYNRYASKPAPPVVMAPVAHTPREIQVNSGNASGIINALAEALPGDSIVIPAGDYVGPLVLKDRINLLAQLPGRVVVRSDAGPAVVARGVKDAHIKGLHIEGKNGFVIADSTIEVEDVEVTGASDCGLRISGNSHPLVMGGNFHNNSGPGVIVEGHSSPRLMDNRIADNGRVTGAPHVGIEIGNEAQPTLLHNEIFHNGLPAVFPPALDEEIRAKNTVDPHPPTKPGAKSPHPPAHIEKAPKPETQRASGLFIRKPSRRGAAFTGCAPSFQTALGRIAPLKLPTPEAT